MILLDAPELGQAGGVDDLKHSRVLVLPGDVVGVATLRVVKQLLQKVPKEPPVRVQLGCLSVRLVLLLR
jgi:hypothetical protein